MKQIFRNEKKKIDKSTQIMFVWKTEKQINQKKLCSRYNREQTWQTENEKTNCGRIGQRRRWDWTWREIDWHGKRGKQGKLKRELLKILNWYDPSRVGPCESWRPEDSENVVVFEIWRFKTKVIGCQSRVKFREKILVEMWRHKKKSRPQYWVLRSETESAWAQHGWFNADSMAEPKTRYCGRVFFS